MSLGKITLAVVAVFASCGLISCDGDTLTPPVDTEKTWCITDPALNEQTRHRALTGVLDEMKTLLVEDGSIHLLTRTSLVDDDRNRFQILVNGKPRAWGLSCADPLVAMREMTTSVGDFMVAMQTFSTVGEGGRAQMLRLQVTNQTADGFIDLAIENSIAGTVLPMTAAASGSGVVAAMGATLAGASESAMACRLDGGAFACSIGVTAGRPTTLDFQIVPGDSSDAVVADATQPVAGAELVTDMMPPEPTAWDDALAAENARLADFATGVFHVELPDPWYQQAFMSSAVLINMLRDKFDDLYVIKPGACEYNSFWYRDAAYISHTMDVLGLHDRAEESMRVFWQHPLPDYINAQGTWGSSIEQKADGRWEAPKNEWDGQGQALWALVGHYRFTRSQIFLGNVYPAVKLGAEWLPANIKQNDAGYWLLPEGYGETLDHWNSVLNHDYWGVLGFGEAAYMAAAAEDTDAAALFAQKETWFRAEVARAALDAFVGTYEDGYIAPALGSNSIRVWGSIATVYPPKVLDPMTPEVGATLEFMWNNRAQDQYRFEDDDNRIWTYMTAEWAQALLIRGEWERAYTLFKGFRRQASPVFAWWEEKYLDSGKGRGDSPHGWAAADYILWLRNMLVRETSDTSIDLLGGVPPDWYVEGSPIVMSDVPTTVGLLTELSVVTGDDYATRKGSAARHELAEVASSELVERDMAPMVTTRTVTARFQPFLDVPPESLSFTIYMRGQTIDTVECDAGTPVVDGDRFTVTGTTAILCTANFVN